MPIYEYRCLSCKRKVSIFWRSIASVDESQARCAYCGSARLSRLASRVRVIRGGGRDEAAAESSDADDMGIPGLEGLDENDPRSLGRFLRKMAAETGEDMGPEFDEVVGRLEKGEDPEKIEESMGDLFGEPPPGLDDDDMGMGAPPSSLEDGSAPDDSQGDADAKSEKQSKTPRRQVAVSAKAKRAAAARASRKPARSSSRARSRARKSG